MATTGKAGLRTMTGASGSKPATAGSRAPAAPASTAGGWQPSPRAASPNRPAARPAPRPSENRYTPSAVTLTAREASRARRKAMATRGKAGLGTPDLTRRDFSPAQPKAATSREASACECGSKGRQARAEHNPGQNTRQDSASRPTRQTGNRAPSLPKQTPTKAKLINRKVTDAAAMGSARAASRARRKAMATRGKAGLNPNGISEAQTVRVANPDMSSRDLARAVRTQRSQRGGAGQKKSGPCGRKRSNRSVAGNGSPGAAQDAPWKVGASETTYGQTVTGTQVGRSRRTTGDEPSTCREITGTEYMGANIFREFCQSEPSKSSRRGGVSPTGGGNRVTGNEVGRSRRVTGDESGTCKRVTGSQYVAADQSEAFCGTKSEPAPMKVPSSETRGGKTVTGNNVGRSARVTGDETGANRELTGTHYMQVGNGKAPPKVGASRTLRGGSVTGTLVGRSERVTGDEPGTCRNITGDDYIGREQYSGFCPTTPKPEDCKVGVSRTLMGQPVSGTLTGRSTRVTGDEPGTCKAITGTPYAGAEQYRSYCRPEEAQQAEVRTRQLRSTPGSSLTGQQPGIGGKLTGAEKGACETVSGTPYVGAEQFAAACPATPAEPGSPDFPQMLSEPPWEKFSVTPPSQAAQVKTRAGGVTGSTYEKGQITGPFGMATGKVTGTEEARFGSGRNNAAMAAAELPPTAGDVDGRVKSRITGEGMDAGLKITGDDWDRGDRVTGTEGTSAMGRNPTRRGPMSAMPARSQPPKRNEEAPEPLSKVTGSSGNTARGALVTYSGGARG
ncbi:CsoS2 family carboxysome shell protein [Nitrococcus mobilis]|uniref:CsoS2 family carboxysome shell protein n=1 Tax=Nitrococcus mobilis TaxID=35797 RepID=UPI0009FE34FA|nr:CsoS2 family carboxysome shell protein [Nitrococcus mobilis]